MASDESLTLRDYSPSVMRAHASNNWAVFYAGRSDCEGWVRVTKMSQTSFWGVNLPLQSID